ncbi:MAG: toprim domain-containing protein [Synergistaceae bacterium]|nr:toprim domain-containing protein [Synergistaceae bacterium]MBR2207455.1 toprim domain-containing protein [Synergistaceae bacterium]
MNREKRQDIERYIKERSTEYFQPDKSGKGYICPICGSGSGKNGTGITENPKDKGHFTCWGGDCFKNADIFEIIGKQFNLTDFNEIFNRACEIFRIPTDTDEISSYTRPSQKPKTYETPAQGNEIKDLTEFFRQAAANIEKTNYHRGISRETLNRFNVGFVPEWRVSEKAPYSPRLIIPNDSGNGYLARDTRTNLTEQEAKYSKIRQGKASLFNSAAFNQTSKPVFIVEGEIDALSIIDAGGVALGLCSVANIGKLIEAIKERQTKGAKIPPLIIQLDSDVAGQAAIEKLTNVLKELKFFSYRHLALPEGYKDANEFLMKDRAKFSEWLKTGENFEFTATKKENQQEIEKNEAAARENFENEGGANIVNEFAEFVLKNQSGGGITTGFETLDKFLDGGLYPGLYVLGAISSLGKTTFIMQIADSIAKSGRGVLIFSLEMSKFELLAKTLSRMSFVKSLDKYQSACYAKTTRSVLLGHYRNEIDSKIIAEAMQDYSEWGSNIHITEGIGNIGVSEIKAKIEEFKKFRNEAPVIVIDYLQILAPFDLKMTDKQNVDKNILELKRLSRDFDIPILGISSFNRENYNAPVSMASFKESGAIEYSSDVLIGLQYEGWDYEENEAEALRLKRLRRLKKELWNKAQNLSSQDIQLKILKNRNGIKGDLFFDFFAAFNYFRPRIENED